MSTWLGWATYSRNPFPICLWLWWATREILISDLEGEENSSHFVAHTHRHWSAHVPRGSETAAGFSTAPPSPGSPFSCFYSWARCVGLALGGRVPSFYRTTILLRSEATGTDTGFSVLVVFSWCFWVPAHSCFSSFHIHLPFRHRPPAPPRCLLCRL